MLIGMAVGVAAMALGAGNVGYGGDRTGPAGGDVAIPYLQPRSGRPPISAARNICGPRINPATACWKWFERFAQEDRDVRRL